MDHRRPEASASGLLVVVLYSHQYVATATSKHIPTLARAGHCRDGFPRLTSMNTRGAALLVMRAQCQSIFLGYFVAIEARKALR
jgi:hypothetical protein